MSHIIVLQNGCDIMYNIDPVLIYCKKLFNLNLYKEKIIYKKYLVWWKIEKKTCNSGRKKKKSQRNRKKNGLDRYKTNYFIQMV